MEKNVSKEVKRIEIQPGDSITLHVQLTNQDSSNTDWYMTNEVLQTLEDAQDSASGAAYEYRLTYVDSKNKETVLYDSSTVGGEGSSTAGEGLKQADASLDEYFYLGRLAKGESGTVYLKVGVEGETGNNGYQQTLAKLRMTFAVEKVKEGKTIEKNTVIEKKVPQKNNLTTSRKAVKTGDNCDLFLLFRLALNSYYNILFCFFLKVQIILVVCCDGYNKDINQCEAGNHDKSTS